MKNKSTLSFSIFLIVVCFSFLTNAQAQKFDSNAFDLEILTYSDKPNKASEHYHLLEVTNNLNTTVEFKLFVNAVECNDSYTDIIKNQIGQIDQSQVEEENALSNSSLSFELYNETLSSKLNSISLSPKESIKFYVKISRGFSSEMGVWKCSKVFAALSQNNIDQNIKKSVVIRTFIPDPNKKGH